MNKNIEKKTHWQVRYELVETFKNENLSDPEKRADSILALQALLNREPTMQEKLKKERGENITLYPTVDEIMSCIVRLRNGEPLNAVTLNLGAVKTDAQGGQKKRKFFPPRKCDYCPVMFVPTNTQNTCCPSCRTPAARAKRSKMR